MKEVNNSNHNHNFFTRNTRVTCMHVIGMLSYINLEFVTKNSFATCFAVKNMYDCY